jgi:hypothetical protein
LRYKAAAGDNFTCSSVLNNGEILRIEGGSFTAYQVPDPCLKAYAIPLAFAVDRKGEIYKGLFIRPGSMADNNAIAQVSYQIVFHLQLLLILRSIEL